MLQHGLKGTLGLGKEFLQGEGRTQAISAWGSRKSGAKTTFKASMGYTNFKVAKDAGVPDYVDYSVGCLRPGQRFRSTALGWQQKSSYLYAIDPADRSTAPRWSWAVTKAL
jgi:hypothetical protein